MLGAEVDYDRKNRPDQRLRRRRPDAGLDQQRGPGTSHGRGRGGRGERRRGEVNRRVDVIIIGGGVTGASIAFHLAALGVRDVLLLERKFLAAGGTGRSVGIVRQLYPTPETSQMVVRSLAAFRGFRDVVGGESGYIDCGVVIGVSAAMRPKLEATVIRPRSFGVRAWAPDAP